MSDPKMNAGDFKATFQQAATAMAVANLDGRFIEVNKRCADLLGYTEAELLEKTFLDITHPLDIEETKERVNSLLRKEISEYILEKRYLRKDDSVVWSRTTVTVLRDEGGAPLRFVGILEDISGRKEIEEALRRSEHELKKTQDDLLLHQVRLESIIEYSEDAIITKSLTGIIQSWNPSAERIFGFTKEEAVGNSILLIIPDELQGEEREILGKISQGKRVEHLETERKRKDGKRIYISVTSSPIKNAQGTIVGATKIARDITPKRISQRALEESEARYKALAEERSRLLQTELLARQQVEEANRIKDQFLATLSHELRTPLNAILGWAQLIGRKLDEPLRVQEGLQIIERNARSQAQIIEDLLDMNRIVSGTLHLEMRAISIHAVVEEAIETVMPSAQSKQIEIVKEYHDQSESVHADGNRLKQIVWNLLTNAVKFTNKNGTIRISLKREGSIIKLRVTDTGVGISSEFLPFIFDRFSQADISSSRRYGGLGLGLSIVRHLVDLHGGEISVESKGLGCGASFTVALPVATFLEPQPLVRSVASAELERFVGLRTLVVDDEPDARNLIRELLEERGMEVTAVGSAQEGIDILSKDKFDLIVSDIGMPSEDGYSFIRRVRKLRKNKKTPAIALTAFARSEDRVLALGAGFQMHVAKPVEASELIAVTGSLLRFS